MADLTLLPPVDLSDMEKALLLIKDNLEVYLEFQEYQAIILKSKYDALIKEGFNDYQALELCKTL